MPLAYNDLDYVTITVGAQHDWEGNLVPYEVTLQAMNWASALHLATGDIVFNNPIVLAKSAGEQTEKTIVASDTAGLSVTDFDWTITVRSFGLSGEALAASTRQKRVFLEAISTGPIDFDTMVEVETVSNAVFTTPVVQSIEGLSGHLTAEDLAGIISAPDMTGYATLEDVNSAVATKVDTGDSRLTDARAATDASVAALISNSGSATRTSLAALAYVKGTGVTEIEAMSAAAYAALGTKVSTKLYAIT